MAESTRPLWAVMAIGVLFVAMAGFGAAVGLMDGEGGVIGAKLLFCALRPW